MLPVGFYLLAILMVKLLLITLARDYTDNWVMVL